MAIIAYDPETAFRGVGQAGDRVASRAVQQIAVDDLKPRSGAAGVLRIGQLLRWSTIGQA